MGQEYPVKITSHDKGWVVRGAPVHDGAGQNATVAENYVELAKILGVTRRSLQNWRRRMDVPQAAANGFNEVAAWREFMQCHGLEGASVHEIAQLVLPFS